MGLAGVFFSIAEAANRLLPGSIALKLRPATKRMDAILTGNNAEASAQRASLIAFIVRIASAAIALLSRVIVARWTFWPTLTLGTVTFIVNVILNLLRIPRFGLTGAAVSTTLSMAMEVALVSTVVFRTMNIPMFIFIAEKRDNSSEEIL